MGCVFSKKTCSLEESCLNPMIFYPRFPHIAEQIFEQLDGKSLKNCREVAKLWQECIDDKNLLLIKIVEDIGGNKAFQLARKKGPLKMVEMLIQNAAKFNIDLNRVGFGGMTAFHWACTNGQSKIAKMLMQKSTELNIELLY